MASARIAPKRPKHALLALSLHSPFVALRGPARVFNRGTGTNHNNHRWWYEQQAAGTVGGGGENHKKQPTTPLGQLS